jgi:hypothetical protein
MKTRSEDAGHPAMSQVLEELARDATNVVRKARKNQKSLGGDNYYANKLATLRADATNAFRSLAATSAGDALAIAELIESVFSISTPIRARTKAYHELCYNLRTTWRVAATPRDDAGLFPLSILSLAKRGYLVTVGRQMNGCFAMGWYDAAAVMMRRLLEISIIEAFEGKGIAGKIRDTNGSYFQLTDLVGKTLVETSWTLSRNAKKALPSLKDIGHMSAHGRYYSARHEDLEAMRQDCRIVIEELLHHAGLL